MGLFDSFTKKNTTFTIPDNSKIIFSNNFLIVGENYECRKNQKKQRKDVIKKTKINDAVHIEKFMFENKPAYMIVNSKMNLDLGVLSTGAASWLSQYYSKGNTVVKITDKHENSYNVDIIVYKN